MRGSPHVDEVQAPSAHPQGHPRRDAALGRDAPSEKVGLRRGGLTRSLRGEDERLLLIIGPCSADREDSVLDYVTRLAAKLAEDGPRTASSIIPRVYTNKPRTKGIGLQGAAPQPRPRVAATTCSRASRPSAACTCAWSSRRASSPPTRCSTPPTTSTSSTFCSLRRGGRALRGEPGAPPRGLGRPHARGHEEPHRRLHRASCSTPSTPRRQRQTFIFRNWEVNTTGNPLAHAVLRGYVGLDGHQLPQLPLRVPRAPGGEVHAPTSSQNPAAVIDCNHDNSGKRPLEQIRICHEVLDSCRAQRARFAAS